MVIRFLCCNWRRNSGSRKPLEDMCFEVEKFAEGELSYRLDEPSSKETGKGSIFSLYIPFNQNVKKKNYQEKIEKTQA